MRQDRLKWMVVPIALLFIAFTGCFGGGGTDPTVGDLELTVTIPGAIDVHEVSVALVRGTKKAEQDLTIVDNSAMHTFKKLETGTWEIIISGKDQKGEEIAAATAKVTIEKNKTTKRTVGLVSTLEDWLGVPNAQPSLISAGVDKQVWLRVLVNVPADRLATTDSAVELFAAVGGPVASEDDFPENGGNWTPLGNLYDNGILGNGDEIKGDRIFSGYFNFHEDTAGMLPLKIVVTLADETSETKIFKLTFVDTSELDNEEITSMHEAAQTKLQNMDQNLSVEELLEELATKLKDEETGVVGTSLDGNLLQIDYASGLQSFIALRDDDDDPVRGANSALTAARKEGLIPLQEQTRGATTDFSASGQSSLAVLEIDENLVGSRAILFWSPFAAEFSPNDESMVVSPVFRDAELGFDLTILQNFDADVDSLRNIANYGLVVMATHGGKGRWLATGEIVTASNSEKYLEQQVANQMAIWQEMKRVKNGNITTKEPVYAVNNEWLANNLEGKFPNSIIVNSSCESTMTSALWNVFKDSGAGAYFGFDQSVKTSFALKKVKQLSEGLAEGKTTGESYEDGTDPVLGARWQMWGKEDLCFMTGLLNGSFEEGLAAWTTDGDGRVISNLAFLEPTNEHKMGIISTGLGFTTAQGSVSQTFHVDNAANELKLDWNFLSEEFLEFIGTQYMDWFKVSLEVEGQEIVLFQKTIDDIAADFGASHCDSNNDPEQCIESGAGGELISVSPEIVFDQGDVWMTGWQSFSCDFTEFRNKKVTLTLGCHDVGDSIYDTAILLDNIRIE